MNKLIKSLLFLLVSLSILGVIIYPLEFRRYTHDPQDTGVVKFIDAGTGYVGFVVDPEAHEIDLVSHHPEHRRPIGLIEAHEHAQHIAFATNGGIFDAPNAPKGLTVSRGSLLETLDVSDGEGNFYMKPNGVFFVTHDGRSGIATSNAFDTPTTTLRTATQSGPMLVSGGALHPAFRRYSRNERTRSAVGVRPDGKTVFVVSLDPVRFWDLATLLRDGFGCTDALYLDGTISGALLDGREATSALGYASLIIVAPKLEK